MPGRRRVRYHPIAPAVVGGWLHKHLEPGDLVFTACADRASRLIRWGTLSNYSHVAVCVDRDRLVEAYDRGMTIDETDGGVFSLSFDQFAGRGDVTRLGATRPRSVDVVALRDAADHSIVHSPTFASLGAVIMALLGTAVRVKPRFRHEFGTLSLLGAGLAMRLLADGPSRVQCAEFVARLFGTTNAPPNLDHLRLHRLAGIASRDIEPLGGLPQRAADSRKASGPSKHVLGLANGLWSRAAERSAGDVSDFVVPADLWDSPSFDVLFELKGRTGGHIELSGSW